MSNHSPLFSSDEAARRGDDLYERDIRAKLEPTHSGRVVAIDLTTGSYEVGDDAIEASDCLLAHRPDAEIWFVRVGQRTLHRILRRSARSAS